MLLEKLLKGFNYSTSTFNLKESKLFDQYFERILISKGTFLVKEGEIERYSYFVFDFSGKTISEIGEKIHNARSRIR